MPNCWGCRSEAVTWIRVDGRSAYTCSACGGQFPRSIVIDPAVRWWVDAEREYWHESVGMFVRRRDGRFLFFERIDFPVQWTVPSGHVDSGETAAVAAARELTEEVGLAVAPASLTHVGTQDIIGDSCRRGADAHRWHAYLADVTDVGGVQVLDEGMDAVWLRLDEAADRDLTVPVRHMLTRYAMNAPRPVRWAATRTAGRVLSDAARAT